jgi:hypothetical protein
MDTIAAQRVLSGLGAYRIALRTHRWAPSA